MHWRTRLPGSAILAAAIPCLSVNAQAVDHTFESASVKQAAPDEPMQGLGFMIGLSKHVPPHGLLTMTGPLAPYIVFAYGVQDEVEARAMRSRLPDWAQKEKFTIVARLSDTEVSSDQLREMMRQVLEERFALKAHRETHTGTVSLLSVIAPGALGPQLTPHPASDVCVQRGSPPPDTANSAPLFCGLDLSRREGGMMHVRMVDVTLPEACTLLGGLGGVLGGRSMDRVVDATGLTGRYDLTLDFHVEAADGTTASEDAGGPTFTGALEKQLGLRLKKGTGQVEDLMIDYITQPLAD